MVTVYALKKALETLGPEADNRIVVVEQDSLEGRYAPFAGFLTAAYRPETGWHGEIGREAGATDDDLWAVIDAEVMTDGEPALLLLGVS